MEGGLRVLQIRRDGELVYAIRVYNLYILLIISVNRTTAYVCIYIDLAT